MVQYVIQSSLEWKVQFDERLSFVWKIPKYYQLCYFTTAVKVLQIIVTKSKISQ